MAGGRDMGNKTESKIFVVRKYIRARSAAEAIRLDRKSPVDDVWVEEGWKQNNLSAPIGFAEKAHV